MVESSAKELSEEKMIEALEFAQSAIQNVINAQEELMKKCGKPKMSFQPLIIEQEIIDKVKPIADEKLKVLNDIYEKNARSDKYKEIINEIVAQFLEEFPEQEQKIKMVISDSEKEMVRNLILKEKRRPDGRKFDEVRPIECKVAYLPRAHGSALFTRGQTQSLGVVTLGSISDKQRIDNLEGESTKRFMLHYNFPPYSVGEVKPLRGPGRREIGHGALAERSLIPVIPPEDDFPYTIRIVSEILESNGSSSMAAVCSGSLSLMDAGVPIKSAVAGIAMGLVMENNEYAILTDIQGIEDHLGDMDFKVAGTENGITSLQMDLKIGGLSKEILREALEKANVARKFVLSEMAKVIDKSRPDLSPHAPRVIKITVATDKIRDIIGPGGKVIRNIIEKTGTTIDILDNGDVFIYSKDKTSANAALEMINYISAEVEVGKIYNGKVVRVTNFGAFVEILPGKEGLVHISQLADRRVNRVEDICREGDELLVKCVEIDSQGRINLSRKLALQELNESKK
jgi:polyribonucleotide nucleotidyltransferase